MKVKKKGSGQPSPAAELEGPGAGAAGGLLLPNRVGQEEPIPTPRPGERGLGAAASSAGPPEPPYREVARPGNVTKYWSTGARRARHLHWLRLQIS